MRLLLVEDDARLGQALLETLRRRNWDADHVDCLADARHAIGFGRYGSVILDRRLPDGDGVSLIPDLLKLDPKPGILILTASGGAPDVVAGLDAGADDYLAKPFRVEVLEARLRALLRRPPRRSGAPIRVGNVALDPEARQVTVNDSLLLLPRREASLLSLLIENAGRVTPNERILSTLYGMDDEVQPSSIQPHVSRLRSKLNASGAAVVFASLRGIGYLLREAR